MNHRAEKVVRINDWVKTLPDGEPFVFVVGCFAHGVIQDDYVDEMVSVSEYELSASVVLGKICCAFEDFWGVL
ncbi:hypothetical protein H696_04606 [Fonticula alba]|uniref:Uncharacterized protein n=1 Tax=Fonticula alba TaxID=691883 RepID=A0A058Z4Y2_FONAL|nr:hypothetical protein H696_04606 [Fonticula alba]KCV69196.1 hypothetical protein H696_04606 [Fonticula alba]|eukprot:XP_009496767.1 hypothetical protein H696_04606 [Fonticula alba]